MILNPSPDSRSPAGASVHEAICRRAKEIYIQSGCVPGRDLDNWVQAEREITAQAKAAGRKEVVIAVNGVRFIGEYLPEISNGYVPGEFAAGASVPVRFEGDKMFLRRPNGKELETHIVRRVTDKGPSAA